MYSLVDFIASESFNTRLLYTFKFRLYNIQWKKENCVQEFMGESAVFLYDVIHVILSLLSFLICELFEYFLLSFRISMFVIIFGFTPFYMLKLLKFVNADLI